MRAIRGTTASRSPSGDGSEADEHLRAAIAASYPTVDGASAVCRDVGVDRVHFLTALEAIYHQLVDRQKQRDEADRGPGGADVPELTGENFGAGLAGLDNRQLRQLEDRLEGLLRPLVEGLPQLLDVFGLESQDREPALRAISTLVERIVRAGLDRPGNATESPSPAAEHRNPDSDLNSPAVPNELLTDVRLLRAREASQMYGIDEGYLKQLAHKRKLGVKVGGRYLFSERELDFHVRTAPGKGGRPPRGSS